MGDLLVALDAAALDVLSSRSPSLPERHRSVRALIDWSHALLDPAEQAVLRRLAVFRGGFTLDGAEAVCDAPAPHIALGGLVERSLVELVPGRYRLLETIRAYAGDKLADAGEAQATSRRHAEHYLAVVQRAERGLRRADPPALRAIAADLDNLRAADAWARASDHRLQAELAVALGEFWWAARRPHEGLEWIDAALARASRQPATTVRAELLLARAQLIRVAGRASTARAEADARAALAVFEEHDDDGGVARSLIMLGWEAMGRDDRRFDGGPRRSRAGARQALGRRPADGLEPVDQDLGAGARQRPARRRPSQRGASPPSWVRFAGSRTCSRPPATGRSCTPTTRPPTSCSPRRWSPRVPARTPGRSTWSSATSASRPCFASASTARKPRSSSSSRSWRPGRSGRGDL